VNDRLRTFRDTGGTRDQYLAYGSRVLAAADGKVTSAVDTEVETDEDLRRPGEAPDAYMQRVRTAQMGRIGRGTNAVIGNHVVIEHAAGEYSVYAHLKPGSLRVKEGDRVRTGDYIAQVGTSGNSTEPHLHFHISDANSPLGSEGLPYAFRSFEVQGKGWGWKPTSPNSPTEKRENQMPVELEVIRFPN